MDSTYRFGCLSTPISVSCGENIRASPHGAVFINKWNLMLSRILYNWSDCVGRMKMESFAVPVGVDRQEIRTLNHSSENKNSKFLNQSIQLTCICMQF